MRTFNETSQPLRVLQLLPDLGVGGAEQMAGHLMTGLAGSHSVTAVSLGKPMGSFIEDQIRQAGIPILFLGKRPGFDPRMFFRLHRVLRKVQPDVVHTHLSVLRYLLPLLPLSRIPVVVHTLHNIAERETDAVGLRIQKVAFRKAVQAVAICDEVAGSFQRVYGMQCRAIIPNGVAVGAAPRTPETRADWRAKQGLDPDAVVFIAVGRLEPQKNPFLLMQSFAELQAPRTHLLMVGHGDMSEAVALWVRANHLEHRIHLLGLRNDVADCLAASDIFILSSDWEGHPLAVMEAMTAGLPVVATAVGGVPELVQSGVHGVLVSPGDSIELTAAMKRLAEDPERRSAMGKAARRRALAAFGVDRMVRSYADFYAAAIKAANAGRRIETCFNYTPSGAEVFHE
jgi:glycosyltransferase involved in cell wall biosynthesis